eukprot:GHVQ01001560.1.p1 GENE.GHVQ01001560.1~~GHVQ01001560.1.p1  ORF type:complete len:494 (+),score=122.30 GHVQ01001560.1:183-1664(+)
MSAGDIHSILYRGEDPLTKKPFEPKFDPNKRVQRYWPGRVPDYAGGEDEEADEDNEEVVEEEVESISGGGRRGGEVLIDTRAQDRRLQRLTQAKLEGDSEDQQHKVGERIKQRRAELEAIEESAELVLEEAPETEQLLLGATHGGVKSEQEGADGDAVRQDGDERGEADGAEREEMAARRREDIRVKARVIRLDEEKRLEEVAAAQAANGDEYESSEYDDTESETDDPMSHALLKPVFVPKESRQTVKEKEAEVLEELAKEEDLKKKLAERKHASHQMLVDTIRREESEVKVVMEDKGAVSDQELPDDADDVDQAEAYELWKIRELKRIKRDKEEREAAAKLLAEIDRRRNLTEEERQIDDRRIDSTKPQKEKKFKYQFMQKYYHRGAFFQDKAITGDEPLYLRDYAAPVGEDAMDKKILPKAMRLRRGQFGRQGQVKHTHLTDVDTTDFTAPWATEGTSDKLAAIKARNDFTRPAGTAAVTSKRKSLATTIT